ncbi:MAG: hypothetical protein AAGD25_20115 [Cyanobacteria bacterium P01_F01_bin.150]
MIDSDALDEAVTLIISENEGRGAIATITLRTYHRASSGFAS